MKPKVRAEATESSPVDRGAFLPSGSYDPDATPASRGACDRMVRALVRERRKGRLTPEQAAAAIMASSFSAAFPCAKQWAQGPHWAMAWTSTSAEEAVKREGRGADGHWCGERWAPGPESDCRDERHRAVTDPAAVADLVSRTTKALDL